MESAERITKVLSNVGYCSRREAERLIAEGRIAVNDAVVTEQGVRVTPGKDTISVDGSDVDITGAAGKKKYFLLNKPAGYITTCDDPFKRPTIFDLMKLDGHFYPVGRLDLDSRGLLIVTNDGDLCDRITHPKNEVAKVYRVVASKHLGADDLLAMTKGVEYEGVRYRARSVKALAAIETPGNRGGAAYEVTLAEGKKREIRQMFRALGARVIDLQRIAIGPIRIDGLAEGKYRELTPLELSALRAAAGYDE